MWQRIVHTRWVGGIRHKAPCAVEITRLHSHEDSSASMCAMSTVPCSKLKHLAHALDAIKNQGVVEWHVLLGNDLEVSISTVQAWSEWVSEWWGKG